MGRYVGSLPPVVAPVDRVTLHEWVWRDDQYGEAVEALQRQEYGPVVAGLDVTGVASGSVSFPAHRGAAARYLVVCWDGDESMYWSGPTNEVMDGDSVSFGPLPVTGTIEAG